MPVFDNKNFNGEVFKGFVDRIPNATKNELIKSKALRSRPDLAKAMADQDGGNFITTTLKGLISASVPQNYDGSTDMTADSTVTFKHSRIVVGRMNAWTEKDFAYDITGGEDFIENIAEQISAYWENIDQNTLVAILQGVFSMTGAENEKFVKNHTHDVTAVTNYNNALGVTDNTTFNTAVQKACGDNKSKFSLAIMHSVVATNLENLKLLTYAKYNDKDGIEREVGIATIGGKLVLIDDSMPTEEVVKAAAKTTDTTLDDSKNYYTRSGSSSAYVYTKVESPDVANIGSYYEATEYTTKYTTYVLGEGAIEYTDCGVKVPYEVDRNPTKNGGEDTLYSRQRKCFAPFGISFTQADVATLSPTDEELKSGANWELVNSGGGANVQYIDHKTIPIARIISLG